MGNQVPFHGLKNVNLYPDGRNAANSFGKQKLESQENSKFLHFLAVSLRELSDVKSVSQINITD